VALSLPSDPRGRQQTGLCDEIAEAAEYSSVGMCECLDDLFAESSEREIVRSDPPFAARATIFCCDRLRAGRTDPFDRDNGEILARSSARRKNYFERELTNAFDGLHCVTLRAPDEGKPAWQERDYEVT